MSALFKHTARVSVGSVSFENQRVAFKVSKDDGSKPNTAEVTISNLNESTRARVEKKGETLVLEAGYGGDNAVVFSGRVRTVDHVKREDGTWDTVITSGDGEEELRVATVTNSWDAGVSISTVLNALVASLGLQPGNSRDVFATITGNFSNGYTLDGVRSRQKLTDILAMHGFSWSIQDGRVQVVAVNEPTADAAILLNAKTGLIGTPTHITGNKKRRNAIRFQALLQPFKPGRRVQIESRTVNGLIRLTKVNHDGDTFGNWVSTCEGVPL